MATGDFDKVLASYERCSEHHAFIDTFYQHFIDSSPEIAEKFVGVDMDHQVVMMRGSLELLLKGEEFIQGGGLERLARLHSRSGIGVPPELYTYWHNSLLETIKAFDHQADADVLEAWKRTLAPGIELMKEHY